MPSEQWTRELDLWRSQQVAAAMARSSQKLRRRHLTWLAEWAGDRGPYTLTLADLINWLEPHEWDAETRRSVRSSLRTFYGWAVLAGRTSDNPALQLPRIKPKPPRPHPTPQQAYLKAVRSARPRERVMLRLAGECGLRRDEVARVHRSHIVEDIGGWWLMVRGKGGRDRMVPLPGTLAHELRVLCLEGGGYAFPGAVDGHLSAAWVGKVVARLLPTEYTMHSLRHRGATMMYQQTAGDILVTQQFLGHSSPATTQLYVAIDRSKMRAAVEGIALAR